MTPSALKTFRNTVPECELAVYVDLNSCTVLSSDGALNYAQEYLDALCKAAAVLFEASERSVDFASSNVLFFSPTGSRGFFRNMSEPNEALCCICSPDIDVDDWAEKVETALSSEARET